MRSYARAEDRYISPLHIVTLRRNRLSQIGLFLDSYPKPIQQQFPIQGVAQHVGMEALTQQNCISSGGPQQNPHLIVGKARKRSMGRE